VLRSHPDHRHGILERARPVVHPVEYVAVNVYQE
jgi:hypothetical protein